MICAAHYNEQGDLILCKDGYARFEHTFNARGLRNSSPVFGPDGKPILTAKRGHLITMKRDRFNWRVARRYFGLRDEPINCTGGYHRVDFLRERFDTCTGCGLAASTAWTFPNPRGTTKSQMVNRLARSGPPARSL